MNSQIQGLYTDTEQDNFEKSMNRVKTAHSVLLRKLFGFVPDRPYEYLVTRETYQKAMHEVQAEFKITEGDPDMVLFVLEQLSRQPRFMIEEGVIL